MAFISSPRLLAVISHRLCNTAPGDHTSERQRPHSPGVCDSARSLVLPAITQAILSSAKNFRAFLLVGLVTLATAFSQSTRPSACSVATGLTPHSHVKSGPFFLLSRDAAPALFAGFFPPSRPAVVRAQLTYIVAYLLAKTGANQAVRRRWLTSPLPAAGSRMRSTGPGSLTSARPRTTSTGCLTSARPATTSAGHSTH